MQNPVYTPGGAQIKLSLVRNDACIFCDGRGRVIGLHHTADCAACYGTGKDDPELFLIMSGELVPPVVEVEL